MASTYRLILQSGAGMGTEYPLEKTELILGRDMSNDLVVNDPEVSRRHARLVLEGANYRLEDLGSTNGTFIRGQRLAAPVMLRPGEIITLGEKVVLRYEVTMTSDPNATVAVQRGTEPRMAPPPAAPVIPAAPVAPPPQAAYQPVPAAPVAPPPQAAYRPIPATPMAPPAAQPKKKSKALVVILVIVGILVLLCVVPFIIVDATNSYCSLFPGIMNMLFTGACP